MDEKLYNTHWTRAQKKLSDSLEEILAIFEEWEDPRARVDISNYVLGYMGVTWGLKYGK